VVESNHLSLGYEPNELPLLRPAISGAGGIRTLVQIVNTKKFTHRLSLVFLNRQNSKVYMATQTIQNCRLFDKLKLQKLNLHPSVPRLDTTRVTKLQQQALSLHLLLQ